MKAGLHFLDSEDNIIDELDLGMVFVGDSRTYEYKLFNNTGTDVIRVDVWLELQSEELEILEKPEKLAKDATGIVKIKWTPSLKIKAGLHTKISAKGIEVWS